MGLIPLSTHLLARSSGTGQEHAAIEDQLYDYPADALVYVVLPGIMISIASIATVLRLWTRASILRRFTMDDWLLAKAQILGVVCYILWLYTRSVERHYAPESPELLETTAWVCNESLFDNFETISTDRYRQLLFTCELLYFISSAALKSSCGLFFLRIPQTPWQRRVYIGAIISYLSINLSTGFILCFRCHDFKLVNMMFSNTCNINWDVLKPFLLLSGISNAITDWVFALVPLHMAVTSGRKHFWSSLKSKTWICILGTLGFTGSIISLCRIPLIVHVKPEPALHQSYPLIFLLSNLEVGFCATAVSLLGLRPIAEPLGRWKEAFLGQKLDSQGKSLKPEPLTQLQSTRFQTIKSTPTVTYSDVKVDYTAVNALTRLGILPDYLGSTESLDMATMNSADCVKSASVSLKPPSTKITAKSQSTTIGSYTLASIVEVGEDD